MIPPNIFLWCCSVLVAVSATDLCIKPPLCTYVYLARRTTSSTPNLGQLGSSTHVRTWLGAASRVGLPAIVHTANTGEVDILGDETVRGRLISPNFFQLWLHTADTLPWIVCYWRRFSSGEKRKKESLEGENTSTSAGWTRTKGKMSQLRHGSFGTDTKPLELRINKEKTALQELKQTSQVVRYAETRDEVDLQRAESWFQKHRSGQMDPEIGLSTNRLPDRNFRQCFICGPRSRRSTRLDKGDLSNTEEKGSISKFFSANFLASTDRN